MRKTRRKNPLTSTEQALYNELVAICNEDEWVDIFSCSNEELCAALRITENTLNAARLRLIQIGLVFYKSGKSKRQFGNYSFTKQLTTSNIEVNPATNTGTNTGVNPATNTGTNPEDCIKLKGKQEEANASVGDSPPGSKESYRELEKSNESIYKFLITYKPAFAEPYVDFWNLFADKFKKAKVATISNDRRKKLAKRLTEPLFKITEILRKAGKSDMLCNDAWFSFDWILKNEGNYLKVLEGNYDNEAVKDKTAAKAAAGESEIFKAMGL